MENLHKVVLISGKMGSGKTTLAKALKKDIYDTAKGYAAVCMNFADPLYEIHDHARGVLIDAEIPFHGTIQYDFSRKDGNLLQLLGTEWGRQTVDPNIWVEVLKGRVQRHLAMRHGNGLKYIFLIADCRFPNELNAFSEQVFKVRLECEKEIRKQRCSMWREKEDHLSETALDDVSGFDLVVDSGFLTVEEIKDLVMANIL